MKAFISRAFVFFLHFSSRLLSTLPLLLKLRVISFNSVDLKMYIRIGFRVYIILINYNMLKVVSDRFLYSSISWLFDFFCRRLSSPEHGSGWPPAASGACNAVRKDH